VPAQISLTVSSLADAGPSTLRAAILAADAGSNSDKFTINFGVSGTIDLQSPLPDLNNNIAIQGPGANSLTVERAAGYSFSSAIVTVDPGQTANLFGLTIANGSARGIDNSGTLTVSGCTVSGNSTKIVGFGNTGGGVCNEFHATLTISNSTISGNSAGFGGGISNGGTLTIRGSIICGNSAPNGTAGGIASEGTLALIGSTVCGNSAFEGGGIWNGAGTVTVSSTTVCGNSATIGGGIWNGAALKVSNRSTLSANVAIEGGGIYNLGTATLQDSTLSGNSATEGGGIDNATLAALDVHGCTFSGNSAGDSGGGIYNLGTATVQESAVSANTAGSAGGGIFNGASGTLAVKDSTVLQNVAPLGADLYNLGALTLDDSTVGVLGP
jgi:predicted outer membrane repeat protein